MVYIAAWLSFMKHMAIAKRSVDIVRSFGSPDKQKVRSRRHI